jgi:hypothetical protein
LLEIGLEPETACNVIVAKLNPFAGTEVGLTETVMFDAGAEGTTHFITYWS